MYQSQKKQNIRPSTVDYREELKRGRWRKEKNSGLSIFISKTFEILENDSYQDIACWNEEGTNFTIMDVDRFEQDILPIYFRHKNFSSFVRQLNMYDFHKIRNQLNRNIFEHRQFRRHAHHLLRNIRRKGCSSKKHVETLQDISQEHSLPERYEEEWEEKHVIPRGTEASIANRSQMEIIRPQVHQNPFKEQLIQDFMASLPEIVESQEQLKGIIRGMKHDNRFKTLSAKQDVKRIVHKIRSKKLRRDHNDGLEELSIEEEIIVENIDQRERRNPTLTILSSQNFLPSRSQHRICSLVLWDENSLKN